MHDHHHHGDTVVDSLNDSVIDLVVGLTMLVTNFTIFVVIQLRKTIEKEYSLLASLVCFNSLFGSMLIYQSYYHATFHDTDHITYGRWNCIKHPHITLLPATACVMSIILPFISFDRYLAVSQPIYYYRLDNNCAKQLAFIVAVLFFLITSALALVMSCVWIGHLTSVILYFAVIRNLKKQHSCSVILRECHNCASHGFVSIRRMFAIFATITLILVVFPVAFMAVHEFLICFRWHHEDLSPQELHAHSHNSHAYFRLAIKISTLNPTINVVVYAMKHKQVYIGVREMFSRKISKISAASSNRSILQKLTSKVSGQSV